MRLALDNHYPPGIAAELRRIGHDVVTAFECGWDKIADDALLTMCAEAHRALMTNNVKDFAPLVSRWYASGRHHAGLIMTDDQPWPRRRNAIGRYVAALEHLMRSHPSEDGLADRVLWL